MESLKNNVNEIEIEVSKLGNFMNLVNDLKMKYPNRFLANNPVNDIFIYRGCGDLNYDLIPSLFRKVVEKTENKIENDKYLALGSEKAILLEFIRYASNIIKINHDDYAHWAEYAQHFGVPTRFLDWSSNPLVALFFACRDNNDTDGCVWLFHDYNYRKMLSNHPDNFNRDLTIGESINNMIINDAKTSYEYPIVYKPIYVDERMNAQKSIFMAWGSKEIPLEEMINEKIEHVENSKDANGAVVTYLKKSNAILFRIIIKANNKSHILRELDSVGVNEMSLFPGLDGIGKYVERRYRFNMKELVDYF